MKKVYRNSLIKKRVDDEETEKDIEVDEVQDEENGTEEEVTEDVPEADEEPEPAEVEVEEEERAVDGEPEPVPDEVEVKEEVTEEQTDENIIEGYAIVFNELSEDLGGFREIIEPSAISDELINNSDIYYLFNHNSESVPLARSKNGSGSLKLSIDNKGLKYSFNCLNNEFYQIVKRNDLDKSSFAFSLPSDGSGEKWEKHSEYNYIRRIIKIERLYDCSAVLVPGYQQTSVYARSNENKKEVDLSYYTQYENIIDSLLN